MTISLTTIKSGECKCGDETDLAYFDEKGRQIPICIKCVERRLNEPRKDKD